VPYALLVPFSLIHWYKSSRALQYGVAFVSLRDNLDLSTPSGRLMFQIIGAMAEFDRALIQERVRSGLRNAKLKGAVLGSPRRVLDGNEALRLRAEGLSFREIARILGASPETVRTRLGAVTKKR
jgi:DNA invertase Pin-like site-specific DNA recombinase